jgi:hypothetical protein
MKSSKFLKITNLLKPNDKLLICLQICTGKKYIWFSGFNNSVKKITVLNYRSIKDYGYNDS